MPVPESRAPPPSGLLSRHRGMVCGRPVVAANRVAVDAITDLREAGESVEDIAYDFDMTPGQVDALRRAVVCLAACAGVADGWSVRGGPGAVGHPGVPWAYEWGSSADGAVSVVWGAGGAGAAVADAAVLQQGASAQEPGRRGGGELPGQHQFLSRRRRGPAMLVP
ncbi:DUF433 domain-containing protein [Streptomyces glaucescens]|uniref:DUF433 domain-containing protein n=1 Tax=Streptomyces glaucescens TaxID=1907 RepID=UPI002989DF7E|nr:DUF433 domain-containing protein [Streptomyces glaucescens]